MNCKKCGEPILEGEQFCSNCGEPVPAKTEVNQTTSYNGGYANNMSNQGNPVNKNFGNAQPNNLNNNYNNNNYNNNYNNNAQANYANSAYPNFSYQNTSSEGMFSNVGKKIETYAKVCVFICIGIASLMLFASFTVRGSAANYAVVMATLSGGLVVAGGYVTALMVYGFGKLIENVEEIKKMLKDKESK